MEPIRTMIQYTNKHWNNKLVVLLLFTAFQKTEVVGNFNLIHNRMLCFSHSQMILIRERILENQAKRRKSVNIFVCIFIGLYRAIKILGMFPVLTLWNSLNTRIISLHQEYVCLYHLIRAPTWRQRKTFIWIPITSTLIQ